jgi:hypothetical protein
MMVRNMLTASDSDYQLILLDWDQKRHFIIAASANQTYHGNNYVFGIGAASEASEASTLTNHIMVYSCMCLCVILLFQETVLLDCSVNQQMRLYHCTKLN